MRLCIKCKYYQSDNTTRCTKTHWNVNDSIRAKIYNPMMFECFDYEGSKDQHNFSDDHLFDLFITMAR